MNARDVVNDSALSPEEVFQLKLDRVSAENTSLRLEVLAANERARPNIEREHENARLRAEIQMLRERLRIRPSAWSRIKAVVLAGLMSWKRRRIARLIAHADSALPPSRGDDEGE